MSLLLGLLSEAGVLLDRPTPLGPRASFPVTWSVPWGSRRVNTFQYLRVGEWRKEGRSRRSTRVGRPFFLGPWWTRSPSHQRSEQASWRMPQPAQGSPERSVLRLPCGCGAASGLGAAVGPTGLLLSQRLEHLAEGGVRFDGRRRMLTVEGEPSRHGAKDFERHS